MKKALVYLAILILLSGCSGTDPQMDQLLQFRKDILAAESCEFQAEITADYGDKLYSFTVFCTADANGNLTFQVNAPESICGISGTIREKTGQLTFDGQALVFPLLADGQVSPVSAPWILIQTLRSGYISSCGKEGDQLHATINDSYEEDALCLDIILDQQNRPIWSEIAHNGRRIISLMITEFRIR